MDASAERASWRMYRLACHLERNGPRCQSGVSPMECSTLLGGPRRDARVWYARPGAADCGPFMRPATDYKAPEPEESQPKVVKPSCDGAKEPVFEIKSLESPPFARSTTNITTTTDTHIHIKNTTENHATMEWSPRMDVVESGTDHIVTIELPGITAENIRVEIDHGKLLVTGSRSGEWWMLPGSIVTAVQRRNLDNKLYYRRDLSYGPYRAVWTLPRNVNHAEATAEFIDGFLRVVIPKTKN